MKSMEHNRLVTFDGTVNFRDIGGYENNEGHDSDGSAGMPADLHAFYARGVYGMGLLTAAVPPKIYFR